MTVLQQSRENCVKVMAFGNRSVGTGFFLDESHVATCFHVIRVSTITPPNTKSFQIAQDINLELLSGEAIQADCVSPPVQADPSPNTYDFAILKLRSRPSAPIHPNPLRATVSDPPVGENIMFSGYPFGVSAMLSHQGTISGLDTKRQVICIQASVNQGNSGGALLNSNGEVLGIISMREGQLTSDLYGILQLIDQVGKRMPDMAIHIEHQGQQLHISQMGIIKQTLESLDRYISTGIGYARPISHLTAYIAKHPL